MTFRHLEIFLIVCRTLSMTKAAEILHMSQPAVSKTIKELEDFYHTSLFERIGKTLQLSESGLALKQYAGTILSQYQESVSFLQEGTAARSCRLCTTVTIAETILPQLYQKIRSELPDLDLQISVCHTKEAEEKLRRHDCDIAIADRREDPSFEVIPLYKDTLVLAVSDRLFPQSHIMKEDLLKQTLLVREKGSGSRDIPEAWLNRISFPASQLLEMPSYEAISEMSEAGAGIAIIPQSILQKQKKRSLHTVAAGTEPLIRRFSLLYIKGRYLHPEIRRCTDLIRKETKSL